MTTQTDTPTLARPGRYVFRPSPDLLLPDGLRCVPKAVASLNLAATAAYERHRAAIGRAAAAEGEVKRATAIDRSADTAASAAGSALPTERAEPAAREAAEQAQRAATAASDAFQQAELELVRAIAAERDTWLEGERELIEDLRTRATELVAEHRDVLVSLGRERTVAGTLERWPEQGALTGLSFGRVPERQQRLAAEREGQTRAELAALLGFGG